ncbi:MAG: SH3 domain-containing protein [Selenomonadaceae bacterium]|nr:SH3 domain-containing protein [Selenomonadaceae bacterium]
MKKVSVFVLMMLVFGATMIFRPNHADAVVWGSVVNCYYVSLRDGPGRNYRKLAELPRGTWVHVYEGSWNNGFMSVFYPDMQIRGWISAKYLSW